MIKDFLKNVVLFLACLVFPLLIVCFAQFLQGVLIGLFGGIYGNLLGLIFIGIIMFWWAKREEKRNED